MSGIVVPGLGPLKPFPRPLSAEDTAAPWFWRAIGDDSIVLALGDTVQDALGRTDVFSLSGGASWAATKYGPALDFGSSGDEVYLGDAFSPDGATYATFGCLVIPATTTTGKPWCSWNDSTEQQWLIQVGSEISAYVRRTGGIQELSAFGSRPAVTAGQVYYIAGRFDGAAGEGALFVNGVLESSNTFATDTIASVTPHVKLGAGGGDGETETQFTGRVLLAWATNHKLSDLGIQRIQDPANWFSPFHPARRRVIVVSAGGTTFERTFAGSATASGLIVRQTQKTVAGTATPAGALARQTQKTLTGSVTPSGTLEAIKTVLLSMAGSITTSGALTLQTAKDLAGSLAAAGSLTRRTDKTMAGSVTPSGTLQALRTVLLSLAGSLTPSGALTRQISKTLTASITATGGLTRRISKVVVGALTMAGSLATALSSPGATPAPRNALGPDGSVRHLGPDNISRHLGPD